MRFDWYQATIQEAPAVLLDRLSKLLEADPVPARGALHGYKHGFELKKPTGTVARVLAGGINPWPNASASGQDTEPFVNAVRSTWPDHHHVTRMDAAQDFQAPGAFDLLKGECLGIADELRLKVQHAGDWHRGEDGRTVYIGSKSSPVRVRCYEKGKQVLALGGPAALEASPDWVRLEVQVRPQKQARIAAAKATPEEAWGYASFTQQLAHRALSLDVPKIDGRTWRETDDERAFRFMCRQYGPMLRRLLADLGSWECVGLTIGHSLDEIEAAGRPPICKPT
jgi:hypothetical protein